MVARRCHPTKGFAVRPGWHVSPKPEAPHLTGDSRSPSSYSGRACDFFAERSNPATMTAPRTQIKEPTLTRSALAAMPCSPLVAALCVANKSIYHQLCGVECYDMARDVRTFAGGMPVVAHPPCRSWSAFCAHQAKPMPGEKDLGPLCVEWLRKCGGVLEHPAHSRLFAATGLPLPGRRDGALWSIEVLQSWWDGHLGTQKKTWLCFAHVSPADVHYPLTLRGNGGDKRLWQYMPRSFRSATCRHLAEWLVTVSRTANVQDD